MRRWLLLMLVGALAGSAALPATAAAFEPPELFWRDDDAAQDPWKPLAGALIRSSRTIELGMRLQPSAAQYGRQAAFAKIATVPDGHSDQSDTLTTGYCGLRAGTAGQITSLDRVVLWEGDGAYSVTVALYPETALQGGACAGPGAATTAAWTVDARPSLVLTGPRRISFLGRGANMRLGVRGDDNGHETRCARDGRRRADGSVTGSFLVHADGNQPFPTSGRWLCTARASTVIDSPTGADIPVAGRWSDPVAYTIRASTPLLNDLRVSYVGRAIVRLRGRFVGLGSGRAYPSEAGTVGARVTVLVSETAACRAQDRLSGVRPMTTRLAVRTRVRARGAIDVRLRLPVSRRGERTFDLRARFGGRPLLDAGAVPLFRPVIGVDVPGHLADFRLYGNC